VCVCVCVCVFHVQQGATIGAIVALGLATFAFPDTRRKSSDFFYEE
jgi:hypothetical protein